MSFHAWTVFALFWVVFVTTPGPNAVNSMSNGMAYGFRRALWGVLAILTQATLFLTLSALGVTALIAASPKLYEIIRLIGAGVLVWLGIRGWLNAKKPVTAGKVSGGSSYGRALMIATINAKSVAGYLAAFPQFVQPHVPLWHQMAAIYPTALTITALSYMSYTAVGALMGRAAMGALLNVWFRRVMAVAFVLYGIALGTSGGQHVRT